MLLLFPFALFSCCVMIFYPLLLLLLPSSFVFFVVWCSPLHGLQFLQYLLSVFFSVSCAVFYFGYLFIFPGFFGGRFSRRVHSSTVVVSTLDTETTHRYIVVPIHSDLPKGAT